MMADQQKTLSMIDFEIEQLRPRARAEAAFAAVAGRKENPWRGSTDQLKALEAEREQLGLRARGKEIVRVLEEYARICAEVDRNAEDASRAKAEVDRLEQNETMVRWKRARAVAASHGHLSMNFEHYQRWLLSDRAPHARTIYEYPDINWPPEIRFDDETDRAILHRWTGAQHRETVAFGDAQAAQLKRDLLLEEHPELQGINLPKREAVAA
jgi:hypothetical protein